MSESSRALYLLAAAGVHALVLWGLSFGPPAMIGHQVTQPDAVEVGLVGEPEEAAPAAAEPPSEEKPQLQEEPPAPEPPVQEPAVPEEPPPPPDTLPDPGAAPRPTPKPAVVVRTKPRTAPRAVSAAAQGSPSLGIASSAGAPGGGGAPGPGDSAHASWRNRVKPIYPESARTAKQAGRVLVAVSVNAQGTPTSARLYSSSGFPALDEAALAAARASTYNPRKIAGIPLADIITVPYSFRLEDRN